MVQTSDFIDSAFLANTTFSDNVYMRKLFGVTETCWSIEAPVLTQHAVQWFYFGLNVF